MALIASSVSNFGFRIKHFKGQTFDGRCFSHFSKFPNHRLSTPIRCSNKVPSIAQFGEPDKLKIQIENFGEKLYQTFPQQLKEFPWKTAQETAFQHLKFLGEKVLKWSLLTLLALSSISDVMLSISRNKELVIPLGLFVGCLVADFFKETAKELIPSPKEEGLKRHLVVMSAFFVLLKVVSAYFPIGGKVLLSHIGNGGLMQILWSSKNSHEERDVDEEPPITINIEN